MNLNRIILLLIVVNLIAVTWTISNLESEAPASPAAEEESGETALASFTERLMDQCKARTSPARRQLLSRQVARIAESTFPGRRDQQESFVLLVCIESAFQSTAKSRVGAVGLTQVMPKYAREFAAQCGLGDVAAEDLNDSEINLTIGACQFRNLLDSFGGNVGLALAGYNAGQGSDTSKKAANLQNINPETANYLARFLVLQEMVSK